MNSQKVTSQQSSRSRPHGSASDIHRICVRLLGLTLGFVLQIALTMTIQAADPPITAAAFTPEGNGIIVGSQAGLRLLSWPELVESRVLPTPLENIHHIGFAPGNHQVLTCGGRPGESGLLEVYDWPKLKAVASVSTHSDVIYDAAWSPDGTTIITASADGFCHVIDVATGQIRNQFSGHSRPVLTIEFLDAAHCVSGSVDQTIRLWKPADGLILKTLNNHVDTVNRLATQAPAADRKFDQIASISEDRTIRIWQPRIGRLVKFARLPSEPRRLVWSRDFRRLYIATSAGQIHVLDVTTMQSVAEQATTVGYIHELLLDHDRQLLFVSGQNSFETIPATDNITSQTKSPD